MRYLWILCIVCAAPLAAIAGGGPENVLLVVNDRSPESLEVAHYYMHRRGIPRHQIVHLRLDAKMWLSFGKYTDYETQLQAPVKAWLKTNPESHITTIVLSRHVPVTTALARSGAGKVRDTRRSTAHMLAVMDVEWTGGKTAETLALRSVFSPIARQNHARSLDPKQPLLWQGKKFPVYCVNTLNAFNVTDAKALVDRAISADNTRPKGKVYLGESRKGDPRGCYNSVFPKLKTFLDARGFPTEIVPHTPSKSLLENKHDVLVFQFGQAGWDTAFPAKNTYMAGAIIDNLTSVALQADEFDASKTRGQTALTHFVAAGASAVHGCVSEPYTAAFDANHRHITRYLAGFNVIESYYMAHPLLPWMNLVAADPLMQPFAERPVVTQTQWAKSGSTGYTLGVSAKATRKGASVAKLICYVDGAKLSEKAGAEATFELAGFDPVVNTAVVVATDDSPFAAQGRLVKQPPFTETTKDKLLFAGLKDGKARFTFGGNVVYTWYAPAAKRPRGTARGEELVLEVSGTEGSTVEIWVHTDTSQPPVSKIFDMARVLIDGAMASAKAADAEGDMAALAGAIAVLRKQPLDAILRAQIDKWAAKVDAVVAKEWAALTKRLPRTPNEEDAEKLIAFARKYAGLPAAKQAQDKLAALRTEADAKAGPAYERASTKLASRDFAGALAGFRAIASRWPLSKFAPQAKAQMAKIKADPGAQRVLGAAKAEAAAARLWRMAKMSKANGQDDLAQKYYQKLLKDHPESDAAQDAKREFGDD